MSEHPKDICRDSGRAFLKTHPWIKFEATIGRESWRFFEAIGEARSKCRHLLLTPLPPPVARELEAVYLAKGALATTAIEGNTLSESQARDAIRGQLRLPESQSYLGIEIQNVLHAIAEIERTIIGAQEVVKITPELLKAFNRQVLDGTPDAAEDGVTPGEYRRDVRVVGNVYKSPLPEDTEFLVGLLCDWLNGPDFETTETGHESFVRVLMRALVAHIYIAWIHPFGNGNGRTARLLEFAILTSAGLPSVSAHLFSNHYNQTRSVYYSKLNAASRSADGLNGFFEYAAIGFVDQLQSQLETVHELVFEIAWRDYIYRAFDGAKETQATRRQQRLALALPTAEAVPVSEIRLLTPQLAVDYDGKGGKTITRDINRLLELELIVRESGGVRANGEIMAGLLPRSRQWELLF